MMRNFVAILILSLLIVSSCNDRKPKSEKNILQYPFLIDINDGLKNQSDIKLSDIADSIKYIILSKDKSIVINYIFNIALTDSNIIAHVSQSPF